MPRTLLDKVWDAHSVRELPSGQTQLFIGLHLVHDVTSPHAFAALRDAALSVPLVQMVAEERTVKGSYIGSCVPVRDIPRFILLYRQGKLPIDRLLSDRIKLDQINEGFERLRVSDVVRQVVVF